MFTCDDYQRGDVWAIISGRAVYFNGGIACIFMLNLTIFYNHSTGTIRLYENKNF